MADRNSNSAVKATGWIRSNSPRTVLGDRTNLPSKTSTTTRSTSTPKPRQSTLHTFLSTPKTVPVARPQRYDDLDTRAQNLLTRRSESRVTPVKRVRRRSPSPPSTQTQDSLANMTPPKWLSAIGPSDMAAYQRIAGFAPEEIRELQQKHMQDQLRKAHKRLAPSSPAVSARPPKVYALETQFPISSAEEETQPLPWSPEEVANSTDEETQPLPWPSEDPPGTTVLSLSSDDEEPALPISPAVRLTPLGAATSFDRVLSSLHRQERKANAGAQLSLSTFLPSTKARSPELRPDDPQWQTLSDDEETQTVVWPSSPPLSLPRLESMENECTTLSPSTKRFLHNL